MKQGKKKNAHKKERNTHTHTHTHTNTHIYIHTHTHTLTLVLTVLRAVAYGDSMANKCSIGKHSLHDLVVSFSWIQF